MAFRMSVCPNMDAILNDSNDILLLFREGCEHGLEFIRMIEEQFPNARFEKETSQEGELIISKKIDIPVPCTYSWLIKPLSLLRT